MKADTTLTHQAGRIVTSMKNLSKMTMTDEQIIKYWNEIDSEIINEHGEEFDVNITMPVAQSTIDLINHQKA